MFCMMRVAKFTYFKEIRFMFRKTKVFLFVTDVTRNVPKVLINQACFPFQPSGRCVR